MADEIFTRALRTNLVIGGESSKTSVRSARAQMLIASVEKPSKIEVSSQRIQLLVHNNHPIFSVNDNMLWIKHPDGRWKFPEEIPTQAGDTY